MPLPIKKEKSPYVGTWVYAEQPNYVLVPV